MPRRERRLVWKLNAVVMGTVILVVGLVGLAGAVLSRHFAMQTARDVLHFNSKSVLGSIDRLMMTRNNEAVLDLIDDISYENPVYRDISLISHTDGEVAVSKLTPSGTHLPIDDRSCAICHQDGEPPRFSADPIDLIHEEPGGGRVLQVITPILPTPACRTGECHAHADSGPILGFLKTDYSLAGVDSLIRSQNEMLLGAALLALLLATAAAYMMFRQILDRPVRSLFRGLAALAANDLDFRFPADRMDVIGQVERTFNTMAARIQAHQSELREAMERLEGVVENSADLIITVSPDGLIESFNRGAEQALGFDRTEVIGQPIEMLFADPAERRTAVQRLEERENVTNLETRFVTKDGENRHVLLTLSRLRDREGNPIGTFGISKDVTTEKDLQKKLLQSEQIAAIGRAVTGIQHAIKNMLNTLRGGLYVAKVGHRKNDASLFEEGCGMLERGLARITDLSQSMLKYAREFSVEPEPTDLARLVGQVESAINQSAKEKGVAVKSEIDDSLPEVPCDPRLTHMVLMDLVTNALEACEGKEYGDDEIPEITLVLAPAEDDDYVAIEVRDNGQGMTPDMVEHAFAPFVSYKKGGTGLGLSLAARIIELHRGMIEVESEPDRGTAFRITLPRYGQGTTEGKENGS